MNELQTKIVDYINLPQIKWYREPRYIYYEYKPDWYIDIFLDGKIRMMNDALLTTEEQMITPTEAKRILEKAIKLENFK